jgi:cysteine desulfurase
MSSSPVASASRHPELQLPAVVDAALPLYLDYNATTPLSEDVVSAMTPFLVAGVGTTAFGNPSSGHVFGRSAKQAFEQARQQVAQCIGADTPQEIVLLSGATESLNYALIGGAHRQRKLGRGNHIISCNYEHIAALRIYEHLTTDGFEVTLLPVDQDGRISPEQVTAVIRPETILISLMLANNEVGAVLPIREIALAVRATKDGGQIWLHTDASQAVGKHPVQVNDLGVDLLTIAGHKLYAPKGIGALYIRASTVGFHGGLEKHTHGANHESDRRAGTENVLLSVGLGQACDSARKELQTNLQKFAELRDTLEASILDHLNKLKAKYNLRPDLPALATAATPASHSPSSPRYDCLVHGARPHRLCNTLSIGFHLVSASALLHRLSRHIAASAGAACHSDTVHLSYVLEAMKVSPEYGMGTLRLSVGRYNTLEEMQQVGGWIAQTVVSLWLEGRDAAVGAGATKQGDYDAVVP